MHAHTHGRTDVEQGWGSKIDMSAPEPVAGAKRKKREGERERGQGKCGTGGMMKMCVSLAHSIHRHALTDKTSTECENEEKREKPRVHPGNGILTWCCASTMRLIAIVKDTHEHLISSKARFISSSRN
jgi:hypothetical protein